MNLQIKYYPGISPSLVVILHLPPRMVPVLTRKRHLEQSTLRFLVKSMEFSSNTVQMQVHFIINSFVGMNLSYVDSIQLSSGPITPAANTTSFADTFDLPLSPFAFMFLQGKLMQQQVHWDGRRRSSYSMPLHNDNVSRRTFYEYAFVYI